MAIVSISISVQVGEQRHNTARVFEVSFDIADANVDAVTPGLIDAAKSALWRGRCKDADA